MTAGRANAKAVARAAAPLAFGLFAAVVLAATVEALVGFARAIGIPCPPDDCTLPLLTAPAIAGLEASGFTLDGYRAVAVLLAVLAAAVPLALGLLVAVRGRGLLRWGLGALWIAMAFSPTYSSWEWARYTIAPLGIIGWFWLIALFPTLTLVPRWAWIPATMASAWAVVTWGVAPIAEAIARQETPWVQLVGPVFLVCVTALIVAQVVRVRRAGRGARRAQGQLLVGLGVLLAVGIGGALLSLRPDVWGHGTAAGGLFGLVSTLGATVVMVVVATAGLQDDVYGVRTAVDSVLTGAVLVVIAATVYAAAGAAVAQLLRPGPAAAVAVVATAAALAGLFQPVRRGIERLVYGDLDAAAVADALVARVASAPSAADVLPGVLDELRARMRWPDVRFAPDTQPPLAFQAARTARVVLDRGQHPVGTLTVTLRTGQRRLTRRDRRILQATAGAFETALTVRRLAETADSARRETLGARERERSELRRRLHDGVGPSLAVARHLVQGARHDLSDDPDRRMALTTADAALADALDQVRRISRDLRPPALDETGAAAAVAGFARDLGLEAAVSGDPLRDLPEEHRVALYRIGVEAVVNARRHGSARRVDVEADRREGDVRMRVADDGLGLDPDAASGVGIVTMRERAAGLGGSVALAAREPHGVVVTVVLPVDSAAVMSADRQPMGEPAATARDGEVAR